MKGHQKTIFFAFTAIAIVAVVFLSRGAAAATMPSVRSAEIIGEPVTVVDAFTSPEYALSFPATLVGLAWRGDSQRTITVRLYQSGAWTDWITLESYASVEREGWQYAIEPLAATAATRLQYRVSSGVEMIQPKFVYADTTGGVTGFSAASSGYRTAADGSPTIITRPAWGADESWRKNVAGQEVWPATYQWPEKFIIHHTAGSDGGTDPEATVRGVYYWHAIALGWGDIGYNYLIDQQGNIYEGRYGGDGVVGAHTYRDKACAKSRFGGEQYEANFNQGTVGIAVLGNYENGLQLNNAVTEAMAILISDKARTFEIAPQGSSFFIDANYPNIVGHRDVDCSTCPGKNLYSQLDGIRTLAETKYEALGGLPTPTYAATFIGTSQQPVTLNAGETKEVWADFRNDGNTTWRGYKRTTLAVVPENASSRFYTANWRSTTEVATLTTPNVAPGEVGRFIFSIKGPADLLDVSERFSLKLGDQPLASTQFTISAQVTGLPYAASLQTQNIKPAVFINSKQMVTFQFKNRGLQPWKRGAVKLNIRDLGGAVSRFRSTTWPDIMGLIDFKESEVKTDELATFTFEMKSPPSPGLYRNSYTVTGSQEIIQDEAFTITRVDSTTQAKLMAQTVPLAIRTVWRPYVTFKFKNVGLTTWNRNSTVLSVSDLGGAISPFRDKTWLNHRVAVRLSEQVVKPGQVGTFKLYLKAPPSAGLYRSYFELQRAGQTIQGSSLELLIRVDK